MPRNDPTWWQRVTAEAQSFHSSLYGRRYARQTPGKSNPQQKKKWCSPLPFSRPLLGGNPMVKNRSAPCNNNNIRTSKITTTVALLFASSHNRWPGWNGNVASKCAEEKSPLTSNARFFQWDTRRTFRGGRVFCCGEFSR